MFSGWVPPVSWRVMACLTWSHMGTTRTLAKLLGSALKPRAEPTGLIADLDHLDAAQLGEDPAAAQAQQLAAAQPGADLNKEVVAVDGPTGG